MKPFQRKRMGGYIRLLRLFETHLKEYHKVFNNDYYKLNYIIQREIHTNDAQLKITLTILAKPFWGHLSNESENLKQILENYCRYFCVSDITIVRPFFLSNESKKKSPILFQPQSIEERVSFDLFVNEVIWREIHCDYV
jgi:hypothetical protein